MMKLMMERVLLGDENKTNVDQLFVEILKSK